MTTTLEIALSKQIALQNALNVTAFNVASQATAGFQGENLLFQEYLSGDTSYVTDIATVRDTRSGAAVTTHDPFHMMIFGQGYFAVQTNEGVRYTRAGTFTTNENGDLITPLGHQVLDAGGAPVNIPPDLINIALGPDGTLSNDQGQIARIGVYQFDQEQDMHYDNNGYLQTEQAPGASSDYVLKQGMYEGSNVNSVAATTELVQILQAFSQNQKVIEEQLKLESQYTQQTITIAA